MAADIDLETIEATGFPPDFHRTLGHFHSMWMMFDVTLDFSLKQMLEISNQQTHIMCAGMEFGRKLRLLIELLKRSNHPKRDDLVAAIKVLQGSKREILTHGYIGSNTTHVTFIYRNRGDYGVTRQEYSIEEFKTHVTAMVKATIKFQEALEVSDEDFLEFANSIS
jgi:hypothetical protein